MASDDMRCVIGQGDPSVSKIHPSFDFRTLVSNSIMDGMSSWTRSIHGVE